MCQLRKKNFADSVAIYGRGRELFRPPTYHIDMRQHANFQQPSVNLTKYQNRVYCLGVKVFNKLPILKESLINPRNLN